jgi:HK97 gp10 family phage protein
MARITVKVDGLRELDAALGQLPKSTGKAVLRRVLKKAGQPIADDAAAKVPVLTGQLQISIGLGTKLTRRQSKIHRKMFKDDKASVEMFVGAGGLAQSTQVEFGNNHQAADPFMRPAWDGNKDKALDIIATELGAEIMKAAQRMAKKAARGR